MAVASNNAVHVEEYSVDLNLHPLLAVMLGFVKRMPMLVEGRVLPWAAP